MADTTEEPIKNQRLEIGKIVGVHGIKGQIKVKAFTEEPSDFLSYGALWFQDGSPAPKMQIKGTAKGSLIVSVAGIAYRDQAEALKGKSLFIDAEDLPDADEDEYYASDLEGLRVLTEDEKQVGTVKALLDFGAGEMLEVEDKKGKLAYYPFTLTVFPTIDLKSGTIRFIPPLEVVSQDEEGQVH